MLTEERVYLLVLGIHVPHGQCYILNDLTLCVYIEKEASEMQLGLLTLSTVEDSRFLEGANARIY